ncbi:hypothetical protein HDK77DRAFT_36863 [Phyllosticta capitalensis]
MIATCSYILACVSCLELFLCFYGVRENHPSSFRFFFSGVVGALSLRHCVPRGHAFFSPYPSPELSRPLLSRFAPPRSLQSLDVTATGGHPCRSLTPSSDLAGDSRRHLRRHVRLPLHHTHRPTPGTYQAGLAHRLNRQPATAAAHSTQPRRQAATPREGGPATACLFAMASSPPAVWRARPTRSRAARLFLCACPTRPVAPCRCQLIWCRTCCVRCEGGGDARRVRAAHNERSRIDRVRCV